MSSSKTATAKVVRRPKAVAPRAAAPKRVVKAAAKSVAVASNGTAPAEALRLSAEIDRALAAGQLDILPPEAMQALFASMCKLYSANVEQGAPYLPVGPRSGVTPTDVMVVASKLLRATNLQVFELGMWQSWTGR
jgi:hypothetical protein